MRVAGQCFAVTWEIAETLRRLAERHGGGVVPDHLVVSEAFAPEAAERLARLATDGQPAAAAGAARAGGGVAVIPITGFIVKRVGFFGFGLTGTDRLEAAVREAVADESVQAILLDIDSPGGGVYGVDEAATVIRQARRAKPVLASANSEAGSAAYWLGAQADEFFVTPSGEAGSIGVYQLHIDMTAALEQAGLKVTLIRAGRYKVEANPVEPLSDEARAHMEEDVERYYGMFVAAVAKGRGASVEAVRKGFGEGRMLGAQASVTEGLADAVGTFQEAIRRASRLATDRRASRALVEARAAGYRRMR